MNPKQLIVPVERGRDSEGCIKMVNGLLRPTLGTIYLAEDVMTIVDLKLFAFLREEIDRTGCGFLCGVELFVIIQQPSEASQTPCLFRCVTEPFRNFICLFRLLYPLLVEPHMPICIR